MRQAELRYPIVLSILAALVTLLLKSLAAYRTDSVGLLSDALESGINLLAACLALFALWYAARPVDRTHTYGHEKMEFFSSGLEGGLVLLAGLGTVGYAIRRLLVPQSLTELELGTVIAMLASLINLAVAQWLLRVGRRHRSIVLEADGQHLMTDVWTSMAVVAGLALVWLTGLEWLDPLLALVIGLNILRTGYDLIRRSFDGLMDHAWPEAEARQFFADVQASLPEGTAFHAVRTRQGGSRRFAEFHFLVPRAMSVGRACQLAEQVRTRIHAGWPGLELTLHIEPIEDRSSWEDSPLVTLEQADGSIASGPPVLR